MQTNRFYLISVMMLFSQLLYSVHAEDSMIIDGHDTIIVGCRKITKENMECYQIYYSLKTNVTDTQLIVEECECADFCPPIILDLTFDGIAEVSYDYTSGSTNDNYFIWQWNKRLSKFVQIGDLPGIEVDPKKKTITGDEKLNIQRYNDYVYKWLDNKFRLVGLMYEPDDSDNCGNGDDDSDEYFYKVEINYSKPDCTEFYQKKCFKNKLSSGKLNRLLVNETQLDSCKEANGLLVYSINYLTKQESLCKVDNRGMVLLNISDSLLKVDSLLNKTYLAIRNKLPVIERDTFVKSEREWIKTKLAEEKKILLNEKNSITAQYHRFLYLINETISREKVLMELHNQLQK